jgi:hypothetical protein
VKAFDFPIRSTGTQSPRHVPQQVFQALIKIYVRLVICPIYSVVKYRPRELASTHPPKQVWVLLTPRPCRPEEFLQPNVRRQQKLTPNIRLNGGADRDRTGGLLVANQALSQLSYSPTFKVVGLGRLELPTSPLSGVRSSHLSYRPGPNYNSRSLRSGSQLTSC